MSKFGELKTRILYNLTEAYASGDKKESKRILKMVSENKDFRELYLFYDDVENINIEVKEKDTAVLYVENIEKLLKEKMKIISQYCKSIDKKLIKESPDNVELYSNLDLLSEDLHLNNINQKLNEIGRASCRERV